MADGKIKTVPRVYVTDVNIARHSGHHTVYVGLKGTPIRPGDEASDLEKLEFDFGVAKNVPTQVFQRFKDAGYATTERPRRREEELEEEEQ